MHLCGTFIPGCGNLLSVLMHFPTVCSPLPLGQEELEFAIMRIEALKLARQIALASRSRQDTKVPVCRCGALPSGNAVCATGSQGCFANHWPGRHCGCPVKCDFSKAKSITLTQTHTEHMCRDEVMQPGRGECEKPV